MTIDRHILVGRDMYGRDDKTIGEVTGVSGDAEYVIVGRKLSRDLLIPMHEIHEVGGRLVVSHTQSYLDHAPDVDPENLTPEDRLDLERFYRAGGVAAPAPYSESGGTAAATTARGSQR